MKMGSYILEKSNWHQDPIYAVMTIVVLTSGLIQNSEQVALPWSGDTKPLYGPEDQVLSLNSTNIKDHIYKSSRGWVLEFYSSWCGHCVNFAPKWKQFAVDLAPWQNTVVIAGIDCADEVNVATCREYEVMGYPSIRFFPPNSPSTKAILKDGTATDDLYRGEAIEKSENLSDMKRSVIDSIIDYLPNFYGINSPISTLKNSTDVWNFLKNKSTPDKELPSIVVVIFEGESTYMGREVALYMSKFPSIVILRVIKKTPLYSYLGLQGWPAAGYFKKDYQSGSIKLDKNKNIPQLLAKNIAELAEVSITEITDSSNIHKIVDIKGNPSNVVKPSEVQLSNNIEEPNVNIISMEDLIHAVRNSLRNEVGLFKQISGPKLQALKNYIHMLAEFFPADRREMVLFLMKLSSWILPFEQIDDTTYLDKLTELDVELHPWDINVNTWGSCKGSIPGYRGYTCSLWILFHTLSVIVHEKNQEYPALDAIHGYVKEFFGCKECSAHFTQMVADDGALMIKSSKDQAIWLWKAHNKVNLRLKGSITEDPSYPKILYPSQTQCPQCYEKTGDFNEQHAFEFLMNIYSKPERTLMPSKVSSERLNSSYHANRKQTPTFFIGLDYWLFCFVYFSVAVLLVFGYLHFRSRGRFNINTLFCRRLVKSATGKNNV